MQGCHDESGFLLLSDFLEYHAGHGTSSSTVLIDFLVLSADVEIADDCYVCLFALFMGK